MLGKGGGIGGNDGGEESVQNIYKYILSPISLSYTKSQLGNLYGKL